MEDVWEGSPRDIIAEAHEQVESSDDSAETKDDTADESVVDSVTAAEALAEAGTDQETLDLIDVLLRFRAAIEDLNDRLLAVEERIQIKKPKMTVVRHGKKS